MVDLLMQICLEAGRALADPQQVPTVPPGTIADQAAREKLVQEVENQITADIKAIQGMLIPSVVACVRRDHSLTGAAALDFQLDDWGTQVLTNLNRLAGTEHTTRPVNDTLDHYLEHVGAKPLADLRTQMVRREGLRYCVWPEECFSAEVAGRLRIRLGEDSS